MTVLENDVIPMRNKLTISQLKCFNSDLKRKYKEQETIIPAKKPLLDSQSNMLNGLRSDQRSNGDSIQDSPVSTLSNMGNTCYLNSVLYTLRFAPNFLHNLHHLIGDLSLVNNRLSLNKAKTSSLGRNVGAITASNSRSTSSKDLLSLGISNDIMPKSKVQIVTERLHELFMTMHNLELKESTEPYQPVALLQAVRDANTVFEGNHQQDAHELLLYLLDNIRETCDFLKNQVQHNPDLLNEPETAPSNSSKIWNVRRSWKKSYMKKDKNSKKAINEENVNGVIDSNGVTDSVNGVADNVNGVLDSGNNVTDSEDAEITIGKKLICNFLAEDFEGITLRRTKCLECESVTERKELFYDIPVPIAVKDENFDLSTVSPSEIYRRACVTSEKLCDANKYLCEKCKRYNEASRDVLFERLPNIMVLQLKRFTSSATGVQKVNTYLPTPLKLECFCEGCSNSEGDQVGPSHCYQLCCVIMHLGGTMASGHYIAYVKASHPLTDYKNCPRDLPKNNLSASCSEKSLNILKFLKPRVVANSLIDSKNGISRGMLNDVKMCRSVDCCGVKMNRSVVENAVNSASKHNYFHPDRPASEDMWLECDDENVRPLTSNELVDLLDYKPNSTSTPYLLFYSKIAEISENEM